MTDCLICRAKSTRQLLDFGPQALCNRFLVQRDEPEYSHPTIVGQCDACGTVQLIDPVPPDRLVPPFDWIKYNEAEGHLDALAATIAQLPGLRACGRVLAISYKDESLLNRLQKRGFDTHTVDPRRDLEIEDRCAGIETLQSRLTPAKAQQFVTSHGPFDVVLVRHVLEHAHAPREFMQAMRLLAGDHGFVVFEVPDCTTALDALDYTTIWDEHTLYLTPATFRAALTQGGMECVHFEIFRYSNENCLAAITTSAAISPERSESSTEHLAEEIRRARRFADSFADERDAWHAFCAHHRNTSGSIALLGAGHLACTFINLMQLEGHIDFVADDHPQKRGLYMPGSKLPIVESAALLDRKVSLCLTIMSAESEQRVIQRQQAFLAQGGKLGSACPGSALAVQRKTAHAKADQRFNGNAGGVVSPGRSPNPVTKAGGPAQALKTRAVSAEVLFADQPFVELDRSEIDLLKQKAPHNPRPRMRVCTHLDDQCTLQEMFIAFTRDAYIRPHKHTHKLVSHHIIEGRADIVFFDDLGEITRVVPMGDYRSGLTFYSRAAEHHYYMLIIRSESLVVHESTQGPFFREGTLFPDWSPPESDQDAARRYIAEMTRRVDEFLARQGERIGIAAAA